MLPKFLSDIIFPIVQTVPTVMTATYAKEVSTILEAVNLQHFEVSDNTTVASLFYPDYKSKPARFEPRTYTESELHDTKMEALEKFSNISGLFNNIRTVKLSDTIVDLAESMYQASTQKELSQ
jgi:hypothetical protein